MQRWIVVCFVGLGLMTACNSNVAVDNPYDPDAPPALQVTSLITGRVSAEAAFDPASLTITVEGLTPRGSPVRDVAVELDDTTTPVSFSTFLPAGTYLVRAEVPGFRADERTGVLVATGEDQDIGELYLLAGRGTLAGRVVIPDPAGDRPAPLETEVTLLRLGSPVATPSDTSCTELAAEESVRARLRADGTFEERNLAVGPFVVIASLDGYLPAVVAQSVEVLTDGVTDVGTLQLTDGEGILTLTAPANPDADPAGLATSASTITANVVLPPVYNGMQLSLMPDFGDVADWSTPATSTLFDLTGASDGEQQLFLRFRAPTCDLSPTFVASIILDTTPPVAAAPAPASGSSCSNDAQVTMDLPGEDPCAADQSCAGLYQMRVVSDGTLDTETFVDYLPRDIVAFPGDGTHDITLELRDAAGNTSAPTTSTVTINSVGPQPGGAILRIDDGSGTVRSLSVLLTFDVTGATGVEVGNAAGLDGSAWVALPPSQQLSWQLAAGADGLRTVVARFRDDCGNVTQEYPVDVLLDRSGMIAGAARLEAGADHSGTVVSFWLWDASAAGGAGDYVDTALTATTSVNGAFSLSGLAAGDYRLVFSHPGFSQRVMDGLILTEGAVRTLGEVVLQLARGELEGSATLLGEGSHEGIRVQAAPGITTVTDSAGSYLFTDLPVGDYYVSATADDAFQGAASPTPATVLEGQRVTADPLVLQPIPGSIAGTALRSGQTTHGGIDVLLEGATVGDTPVQDNTVTLADGTYSFPSLTAGTYRLVFQTAQYQAATAEGVVVPPNTPVTVTPVTLAKATGALRVAVDISDRSNESGVAIILEQSGTSVLTQLSPPDGIVYFASVPADSYTLVARLDGYGEELITPVVVSANSTTDLTTTPIVLTPQIGDAFLQTPAGAVLGAATNLTSIEVGGSFPGVNQVRICESPNILLGGDPDTFSTGNCAWRAITQLPGDAFQPLPFTFSQSQCPDPGDPVAICDGQKVVWVKMQDTTSGLVSEWFPLDIVLDRVAPQGNIVISPTASTTSGDLVVGDGEAYTASLNVSALVAAQEDLSGVAAGGAVAGVVSGRIFRSTTDTNPVLVSLKEGLTSVPVITLTPGADGDRQLYLEVSDAAGNRSVTDLTTVTCPPARTPSLPTDCDAIFVDRTPPPSLAFSIEPTSPGTDMSLGAAWTATTTVTLGIDSTITGLAEDEAVSAIIANDSGFVASLAMPLANPVSLVGWNLTVGDGTKNVYIRVRDAAGNLSGVFSDSIGLDTLAPQIPVLDEVPPVTADASPALSFTGGTGATRHFLQLSDSASFDGSGPGAVFVEVELTDFDYTAIDDAAGAAAYPLADGLYWWRVQAADDADLRSPFTPAQRFEVDTVAPGPTTLDLVDSPTRDTTPTLTWAATTDARLYHLQISTTSDFSAGIQVDQTTAQLSLTSSTLGEGTWYARVQTIDAAGNADAAGFSNTVTFVVDTTAPADAILSAPANASTWSTQPVAFTWASVADAVAYRLEIALNAGFTGAIVEAGLTTTARSLVLDEGAYWARVITTDAAGNRSLGTTFITFTVDTVAPDVPTLNRLPSLISERQPVLSWSDEAASGAVTYLVQVDGVDRPVSGTTTYTVPLAEALADGVHTWTVAARDAAGNTSAHATLQSFTVDATAPATPVLVPVNPDPTSLTQPTLAFAAVGDAVEYEVEWHDNNLFTGGTGSSALITGTSTKPSVALGNGTWHWHVRARDASGNWSAFSSVDDFVVDTTAPADPTLLTPAAGSSVTSTSVDFTWAAVADAVRYQLEIASDAAFTSPQIESGLTTTARAVVLTDGSWWARVRAIDAAGNVSAGAADNAFTVDTTAPDVPTLTRLADLISETQPVLGWSDEAASGAAAYLLQIDGATRVVSGATSYTVPLAEALADGTHTWTVAARDAAGNVSAFATAQAFTVDATAPGVPGLVAVSPDPSSNTLPTLAVKPVSDAVEYELEWHDNSLFTGGVGGSDTVATTSTQPSSALGGGTWYWRARARDAVGNWSGWSTTGSFVVDVTAPSDPTLLTPVAASSLATSSVAFSWSSVADAVAYRLEIATNAGFTAAQVEANQTTTARSVVLTDGNWWARVRAIDAAGNVSAGASSTAFTVDTTAPAVPTLTRLASLINETQPVLSWSNEAASGATAYLLQIDGVDRVVTGATSYTLLLAEALADGSHAWTVASRDAAGNVSAYATAQAFTVDATAPAVPVLVAVAPDPSRVTQPTLALQPVNDAVQYEVQWHDNNLFTGGVGGTNTITIPTTQPAPALGNGTWYWRARARDQAGNWSAFSSSSSFVVDITAPADPSLLTPADGSAVTSNSVAFSWSSVADAATYQLEISTDAAFTAPTRESGLTATSRSVVLGDGPWWARVRAVDAAGNLSAGAADNAFTVDTTPPDVPTPVALTSPTTDATPTFSWSDESASGAVGYRLDLDGTVTSVASTSHTPASNLADGPHSFAVAAVDAAGNRSAYSSAQVFEVDATLPAVPVLTPVSPDPRNTTTVALAWSAVADALSYTVEWDTDVGFTNGAGGQATVSSPGHSVGPLAEGTWYWHVRATDDATNQSAFSSPDAFVIDLSAPINPAPSTPADASYSTSSTVAFTWSSVADAAAYLLDRSTSPTFATYDRSEGTSTSQLVTLPDGIWYWRVLARDAAGNVSPTATATVRSVEVDTVAPAAPVLTSVTTPTNDTTPTLAWSAVTGAASYVVTLDGSTTTVTSPTLTHTPSALGDGNHTWTVAARDAAGNLGPAAPTEVFVVDATAPAAPTLIAYFPDPTTDNTPTVQWNTVPDADTYRVSWSDDGFLTSSFATTSDVSLEIGPLTGSPATTWSWRVESLDALGNASAPSSPDSFLVDTVTPTAPSLIAPADGATATGVTVSFSWSSVGDAASYRLQVGSDATLATIVHDLAGLSSTSTDLTLTDAVWYWRVLATDAAGNQTAPASATIWSVTVDANAPSTPTLAAIATPTNDGTPTFTWSDESGSGATQYLLRIDAVDTTLAALTYTPASNLAEGSHTISVAARDGAGNTSAYSASQTIIVDLSAPSAPANPLPAGGAADTDGSVDFSWDASTDALTAVSYRLQVAQASDFLTLLVNDTPATESATVLLADGTYRWRVRAEDAAGNVSAWVSAASGQSLTIDTTAPTAPDLIPVGATVSASPTLRWYSQAASGATLYSVEVDDDSLFGSPDATGSTSGTSFATTLGDGTWYWRVRAQDAHGNSSAWSSTDTFALDSTPPGPPTNTSPADGSSGNASAVTFSWTAPAGGASSYRLEIAYDSNFTALAWQATTLDPTVSVTISFPDGTYHWRVLALDAVGNESTPAPGATGASFTVDTTAPDRPTVTTTPGWVGLADSSYTLGWSDESDSGAATYQYQVSSSSSFATLETSGTVTSPSTSVTISTIPADGTWYWRVRALDTLGNPSVATAGWTSATSFGVDRVNPTAPGFVAPPDEPNPGYIIAASTVTPEWTASTDTNLSHYQLQISQASDFSNQVVVDTTVTNTLSNQTLGDGVYYWRVRAVDLAGNVSDDWSTAANSRSFTVDTTQPSATSLSPLTSPTSDARPDLAWSAVSDAEIYRIEWSQDPTFGTVPITLIRSEDPAPRAYLQDSDYAVPGALTDGTWYARVIVQDAAGLQSAPSASLQVVIDTSAPSAPSSCALTTLTSYANALADPTPEFTWEVVAGAASYTLEIERWVTGAWQADSTITGIDGAATFGVVFSLPSASSLTDGDLYRFSVEAVDSAGNVSAPVYCVTDGLGDTSLRSDQSGPISGVSGLVFAGANPTSGVTATVQWTAEEDVTNSGEYGYDVSLLAQDQVTVIASATIPWANGFTPGPRSQNFAVPLDGTYYAKVVAWDAALNRSATSTTVTPLVIDNSPPTGTVTITNGEPTNATALSLALTYSGDVTQMRIEETVALDCSVGTYESVAATKNFAIAGVGMVSVGVCFKDAAGNTYAAFDTIEVDRTSPDGVFVIYAEGNPTYTIRRTIQLEITVTSTDVEKMAVSQTGALLCNSAVYEPFSPSKSLTLTGGDGEKTISLCLKDYAGNYTAAPITETITLDLTPPAGSLVIQETGRQDYAWSQSVDLLISASADVAAYYVVNEQTPDCGALAAGWTAGNPNGTLPWTLGGEDQQVNSVAICFQDNAGNAALATDFIVVDLQPPQGWIWLDDGAQYTTDDVVAITSDVPSGATQMAFTEVDPNCDIDPLGWTAFVRESSYVLASPEGSFRIYACFRDESGQTSETYADIIYDRTPPSLTTFSLQGRTGIDCWDTSGTDCNANSCTCDSTRTKFSDVVFTLVSFDAFFYGIEPGDVDCASVGQIPYNAANFPQSYFLPGADGEQTLTLCIWDEAGNSTKATQAITLDTIPPDPASGITLTPGNHLMQVDWTDSVTASDVDHYEIRWNQQTTGMQGISTIAKEVETVTIQPAGPSLANCEEMWIDVLAVDAVGNVGWPWLEFGRPLYAPVDLEENRVRASFRRLQADWDLVASADLYRFYYANGAPPNLASTDYAQLPSANVVIEDGEPLPGNPSVTGNLQESVTYVMGLSARDSVTFSEHAIECWSDFGALASDTTFGLQLERKLVGTVNGGNFGEVLTAGDLNRDGFAEIVVGSPNASRGAGSHGLVNVFDGRTGRKLVHDAGPAQGSLLIPNWGRGLAITEDNDLDGFPELLVGGQGGEVYAFSGRDRSLAWTDSDAGGNAGYAIAAAGLANASFQTPVDGFPEHAVGDPMGGASNNGVIRFYSGVSSAPFATRTFGAAPEDRLGQHLSPAVPLAGPSGHSVMTAVGTGDGFTSYGRVVVIDSTNGTLLGTILGSDYPTAITGAAPLTRVQSVGTGYNWIAVPRANANEVEVWQVDESGISLYQTIGAPVGVPAGAIFGQSVAWFDLDADGYQDLLVGAAGTAASGEGSFWGFDVEAGGRVLLRQDAPQGTAGFGWSMAVADVFNDGIPDIVVGAPYTMNAGGLMLGWVGVYQLTDLSISPNDVRSTTRREIQLNVSGGTPPYTFLLDTNGTGVGGQPQPTVTSDGVYRAGTGLGVDTVKVTDARGRVRLLSIPLISELDGGAFRNSDGPNDGGQLGASLAILGDRNFDGVPEFLVGAPQGQGLGGAVGVIYLYDGATGGVIASIPSPNNTIGDRFGAAVAGVSDVDGDGYAEFLVGAPGVLAETGRVYLFAGTSLANLDQLDGNFPGDRFGENIVFLGQWNGEFGHDFAVAAPGANYVRIHQLVSGAAPSLGDSDCRAASPCVLSLPTTGADLSNPEDFGIAMAHGDITGDLVPELIVGAPGQDGSFLNGLTDAGRVMVFGGAWNGFSAGYVILDRPGDRDFMTLGSSLAVIGDFDDDGYRDILVGAGKDSSGGIYGGGSVSVLSSQSGNILYRQMGTSLLGQLGIQVASSDLDRDGFVDWVIGAKEETAAIQVFDGETIRIRTVLAGYSSAGTGERLLAGFDFDRNGLDDVLFGSPSWDDGFPLSPDGRITVRGTVGP
ncbi:MAG: Ig-like domain-containing protein [Deltaproteobacteria bacterium]|nr:Ig-like domain-containing protein [Deltaproteobacteria bacterium]